MIVNYHEILYFWLLLNCGFFYKYNIGFIVKSNFIKTNIVFAKLTFVSRDARKFLETKKGIRIKILIFLWKNVLLEQRLSELK